MSIPGRGRTARLPTGPLGGPRQAGETGVFAQLAFPGHSMGLTDHCYGPAEVSLRFYGLSGLFKVEGSRDLQPHAVPVEVIRPVCHTARRAEYGASVRGRSRRTVSRAWANTCVRRRDKKGRGIRRKPHPQERRVIGARDTGTASFLLFRTVPTYNSAIIDLAGPPAA